jgi:hypothetical protein
MIASVFISIIFALKILFKNSKNQRTLIFICLLIVLKF